MYVCVMQRPPPLPTHADRILPTQLETLIPYPMPTCMKPYLNTSEWAPLPDHLLADVSDLELAPFLP